MSSVRLEREIFLEDQEILIVCISEMLKRSSELSMIVFRLSHLQSNGAAALKIDLYQRSEIQNRRASQIHSVMNKVSQQVVHVIFSCHSIHRHLLTM